MQQHQKINEYPILTAVMKCCWPKLILNFLSVCGLETSKS